ncbi:hypothetical protein GQ53DRAFT_801783 [Thozetella sp. PMI_491]|nr:hypothetical protein GQ53DRAFT_801783 [Thozetella sp. PMI_491]
MTTNLCGSSRRTIQMLWLAAVLIFFAAVFHSSKLTPSRDWVGNTVQSMMRSSGRSSMKEHIRLAEASWAKTVKERHDLISADWETAAKMPLYYKYPYTVWDFTPASWSCPHEMDRVGRMGDGGKWVCGMSQIEATAKTRLCVIYSFGVRDESSFEDEMLRRTKCEIWAYDFSVVDFGEQLQPEQRARAHFFQAGIARETDTAKNPPFYSIESLMEMNGHDYISDPLDRYSDILKMDIEFAEFEAMDGLSYDFPASRGMELPIGQLLVEIHLFGGRITTEEYLDWWERLEARGLRPAWAEPNLLAVTLNNNGDKNPNMAEYVLINVRDSRSAIFGGAALAPQ